MILKNLIPKIYIDKINGYFEETNELINKEFGKGAIMSMDGDNFKEINSISTGSIKIDDILGGNGVPRGRIIEIFGAESSGKTTLALQIIANCHRENFGRIDNFNQLINVKGVGPKRIKLIEEKFYIRN